jgi:hypothetical protein
METQEFEPKVRIENRNDKRQLLINRFINHPFFNYISKEKTNEHEFKDFLELKTMSENLTETEDLKNVACLIGAALGHLEDAKDLLIQFNRRTNEEKLIQENFL